MSEKMVATKSQKSMKSMKSIVAEHFRILKVLRDRPYRFGELATALNCIERTLQDRLRLLKEIGEIKQLEDKRYVIMGYVGYEELIENQLYEMYKNNERLKGTGMDKLRRLPVNENTLKVVGIKIKALSYDSPEFIQSFKNVMKKYGMFWVGRQGFIYKSPPQL